MELATTGFSLRFRDGEAGLPQFIEQRGEESIFEVTVSVNGTRLCYLLGQSIRQHADGWERVLWIEPVAENAVTTGICSATLLVEVTGAKAVSVPMARLAPATPLDEILRRPRCFPSVIEPLDGMYDIVQNAPDCIPGTVLITVDSANLEKLVSGNSGETPSPLSSREAVVSITPLSDRCPVTPRVYGQSGRLIIEHEFQKELWLCPGKRHEVARQVIQYGHTDWQTTASAVQECWSTAGYIPPVDRPAWVYDAIVYEADLGFHGTIRQLTSQLDQIQAWGFNTVYLMPWHIGNYSTRDYRQIEPTYGNLADLRALTDAAHARGLKVLFDLLLVIVDSDSPYLRAHPDWFYRDVTGKILPHPVWQGPCLDPASLGFRSFLIDYAAWCCTELGADGFRVDSSAHRGGCWNSSLGLQPHEHSQALFTLLQELRAAMRTHNPDAILLAECFGPQQTSICDLVGFQWIIWLDWFMHQLLAGTLTGNVVQRTLGEHFLTLPRDTWLTTYTHTHDTLAFSNSDPQGPAVDALFATLTLISAGTMVFGGGWGMRARPSEMEVQPYRDLFDCKSQLGGIATHELSFPPVAPELFAAARPSRLGPVQVITNFSATVQPAPSGRRLYSRLSSPVTQILPYDTIVLAE